MHTRKYVTGVELLFDHTNLLLSLQCNFNKDLCDTIFEELSDHLFPKWVNSDGNILNFLTMLDISNKTRLLKWALHNAN